MKDKELQIRPTLRGIMSGKEYTKKSDLTIREIKEYYPSISLNGDPWLLALYEDIYNQQLITEFTTQTIKDSKTRQQLVDRFYDKFEQCFIHYNGEDGFWIKFLFKHYKYIQEINKFMDSYGWKATYIVNEKQPYNDDFKKIIAGNSTYLLINYLPKFDNEIDVRRYDYIYHVTPDIAIKKIEEIGLTPKNKSKLSNNPERIYFLLPTNDEAIKKTIGTLNSKMDSKRKKLIKHWYVLRIDIHSLPKAMKFYNDPMFEIGDGAVWTYQNIPPVFIRKIKRIPV
jgi:hypothetical protein